MKKSNSLFCFQEFAVCFFSFFFVAFGCENIFRMELFYKRRSKKKLKDKNWKVSFYVTKKNFLFFAGVCVCTMMMFARIN